MPPQPRPRDPQHCTHPPPGAGGGSGGFRGKRESGKENPYSCCVLAGARSMDERRAALEVGWAEWGYQDCWKARWRSRLDEWELKECRRRCSAKVP